MIRKSYRMQLLMNYLNTEWTMKSIEVDLIISVESFILLKIEW